MNKAVVISDDYPALLRARRRRERWSAEDQPRATVWQGFERRVESLPAAVTAGHKPGGAGVAPSESNINNTRAAHGRLDMRALGRVGLAGGSMDQERAQVDVASLRDGEKPGLAAGCRLTGHEAPTRCKARLPSAVMPTPMRWPSSSPAYGSPTQFPLMLPLPGAYLLSAQLSTRVLAITG